MSVKGSPQIPSRTGAFLYRFMMVALLATLLICPAPVALARSAVTPWTSELDFQNLIYGASTPIDVERIVGRPPDAIVKSQQIFPVILNYYYFDENGSGAATVFVFQNNLLGGLQFKSSSDQYIDLTYFLVNNGDYGINSPIHAQFRPFVPSSLPMYWW